MRAIPVKQMANFIFGCGSTSTTAPAAKHSPIITVKRAYMRYDGGTKNVIRGNVSFGCTYIFRVAVSDLKMAAVYVSRTNFHAVDDYTRAISYSDCAPYPKSTKKILISVH